MLLLTRPGLCSTLITILFATLVPDTAPAQECVNGRPINQADSLALVALYNATNGPKWDVDLDDPALNDPWLQGPVVRWLGVIVGNGRVGQYLPGYGNRSKYAAHGMGRGAPRCDGCGGGGRSCDTHGVSPVPELSQPLQSRDAHPI